MVKVHPGRHYEEIDMKATVGDRLIVESTRGSSTRREGFIVEVAHPDGTPPYVVRWLDSERETLVFPGPDARLVHATR
ncbi:DUF1918 domain-containing protein [Nonomuraea basaltis]|uniref:DUF1918 domain-containing protein n=1 Tax=Nonomuraea basaltis TaxID=2495887 RepID=UPI001F1145BF|nr:DUF1918 domain-containing protein [Nonomuraea basaltis]